MPISLIKNLVYNGHPCYTAAKGTSVTAYTAIPGLVYNGNPTYYQTPVVAPPPAPPVIVPSADGTTIPSATSIVDAAGVVWTLVGGQIARNGVIDPVTNSVTLLLYYNKVVYQTAFTYWWGWINNAWVGQNGDPRTAPAPSPPPASGRSYLIGFYVGDSPNEPEHNWLGYYPDYWYGGGPYAGYQTHSPGGGFNLPLYPVIPDLDVYSNGCQMPYDQVLSGAFDAQINATLNSISAEQAQYIYAMRLDSEFNLQGGYTQVSAATYRAALNHVIALCKAKLPSRVKYCWNPNGTNGGDLTAYVPENCDIIGIDAYTNQWVNSDQWFNASVQGSIAWWTPVAKTLGKQIALPEWGDSGSSSDGTDNPKYINAVAAWANNPANNVAFLGYWESPDAGTVALGTNQRAAFKAQFTGAYGGAYFAPIIAPNTSLAPTLGF